MREPINQGHGTGGIRKHRVPLLEGCVRGDHDRLLLLAPADDLEEGIWGVRIEAALGAAAMALTGGANGIATRRESPRPKSRLTRYQMTADRSSRPAPPRRTDRLWMPMRSRQARPPQIPVVVFLDRILVTCPVLVQRPVPLGHTDLRGKNVSRGASVTFQLSVSGPIFAVFATGNDHGGNK
jgi:hypothetical protein